MGGTGSRLNDSGKEILMLLAQELGKLPNSVSIEGHTDAKPFSTNTSYANWELSANRANSARRVMQRDGGLGTKQVTQVRGFADQRLRKSDDPESASNRRISVVVHYMVRPGATDDDTPEITPAPHEGVKPAQ